MKLIPSSKTDFEACANLRKATDNEVTPFVSDLLEWLKDLNWPVAPLVQERLSKLGPELVEPVRAVLNGNDNIWKYWLVSSFLPLVRADIFNSVATDIERIAYSPIQGEVDEELHLAAQQLLKQKSV